MDKEIDIGFNNNRNATSLEKQLKKYAESLRYMGVLRKTPFLYNLAKTGLLTEVPSNDTSAEKFADSIDRMITVFNQVLGDRWDMCLTPRIMEEGQEIYDEEIDEYEYVEEDHVIWKLSFLIWYPEFEMTNTPGHKHRIKDLYVEFPIEFSGVRCFLGKPSGTRGYLSHTELVKGYMHSHLSPKVGRDLSYNIFTGGKFCLGMNEVHDLVTEIRYEDSSPEKLELLLHTMESMVRWESLEGTPYKNINNLRISNNSRYTVSKISSPITIEPNWFSSLEPRFEVVYYNGRYKVKDTEEFKESIKEKVIATNHYLRNLLVMEDPNDSSYYLGYTGEVASERITPNGYRQRLKAIYGEIPYTIFRGQKREFKIGGIKNEATTIDKYFVHPKFIDNVRERIEEQLHFKEVKRSAVKRISAINNARRSFIADQVSVQEHSQG